MVPTVTRDKVEDRIISLVKKVLVDSTVQYNTQLQVGDYGGV
jgi:hypothetical protein